MMKKTFNCEFNISYFQKFISKLSDLSGIDDIIKIKIDKDDTLMYSILTSGTQVLAIKTFSIPTNDIFNGIKIEDSKTFDFIITSGSKYVKNLRLLNFENIRSSIKMSLEYKESMDDSNLLKVKSCFLSDGKLKILCVGGEDFKIKDVNKKFIETRLDIKKSKWNFSISSSDFSNIKKLSSINTEDKILNIDIKDNTVYMGEYSKWELEIGHTPNQNDHISINKKFLSNVDIIGPHITLHVFETFILISQEDSNLMLSFEQSY
jgi:hypothetical protein